MSKTLHILGVDDDPTSSYLLQEFITLGARQPVQFSSATTVDEGLAHLEDCHQQQRDFPQLIFVDIRLPKKNGFAFVDTFQREYLAEYPDCAIYMLSSSMRDTDRGKSMNHRAVKGFVHKSDLDAQLDDIIASLA